MTKLLSNGIRSTLLCAILIFMTILLPAQAERGSRLNGQLHLPSPEERAAYNGDTQKVLQSLKRGLDVNRIWPDGLTLISYAVSGNHPDLVKLLLETGADPNADHGATMLTAAAIGNLTILRELLAAGGSANIRCGVMTDTPLLLAARSGRPEEVALLLKNKANPDIRDNVGQSAIMMARDCATVRLLLAAGAHPDEADRYGMTALMLAAMYGRQKIASLLLDAGADPSRVDKNGRKAEDYAMKSGHKKLAAMLNKAEAEKGRTQAKEK